MDFSATIRARSCRTAAWSNNLERGTNAMKKNNSSQKNNKEVLKTVQKQDKMLKLYQTDVEILGGINEFSDDKNRFEASAEFKDVYKRHLWYAKNKLFYLCKKDSRKICAIRFYDYPSGAISCIAEKEYIAISYESIQEQLGSEDISNENSDDIIYITKRMIRSNAEQVALEIKSHTIRDDLKRFLWLFYWQDYNNYIAFEPLTKKIYYVSNYKKYHNNYSIYSDSQHEAEVNKDIFEIYVPSAATITAMGLHLSNTVTKFKCPWDAFINRGELILPHNIDAGIHSLIQSDNKYSLLWDEILYVVDTLRNTDYNTYFVDEESLLLFENRFKRLSRFCDLKHVGGIANSVELIHKSAMDIKFSLQQAEKYNAAYVLWYIKKWLNDGNHASNTSETFDNMAMPEPISDEDIMIAKGKLHSIYENIESDEYALVLKSRNLLLSAMKYALKTDVAAFTNCLCFIYDATQSTGLKNVCCYILPSELYDLLKSGQFGTYKKKDISKILRQFNRFRHIVDELERGTK